MASSFDASGDVLTRTTNLPGLTCTLMGWFRVTTDNNAAQAIFQNGDTSAERTMQLNTLWGAATPVLQVYYGNGVSGDNGTTALSAGTWYHFAVVMQGTGQPVLGYLNASLEITSGNLHAQVSSEKLLVGNNNDNENLVGRAAAVKVYSAALTAAEIAQEMQQYLPVRTANLNGFYPLWRSDDVGDYSGNGNNWTVGGTLGTEDGPPIPYKRGPRRYFPPVATSQTVSIGEVTETDLAQSIVWAPKARLVNQVTETDSPQTFTSLKLKGIGLNSETNTSQSFTSLKIKAIGQLSETDLAQTFTSRKVLTLGLNAENDSALDIQSSLADNNYPVGLVSETNLSQAFTSTKLKTLGLNLESDSATLFSSRKTLAIGLNQETDSASAFTAEKLRTLGINLETNLAQTLTSQKLKTIGLVSEADSSLTFTVFVGRLIGQASQTDLAQTFNRLVSVGLVTETGLGQPFTSLKENLLGLNVETDLAQNTTLVTGSVLGLAIETDLVQIFTKLKYKNIGISSELDEARTMSVAGLGVPPPISNFTVTIKDVVPMTVRIKDVINFTILFPEL